MTPSLFLFAMGNNLVSIRNSNYSYTKDRLPAYLPIFSFWFLRKSILMDLLALSAECCGRCICSRTMYLFNPARGALGFVKPSICEADYCEAIYFQNDLFV